MPKRKHKPFTIPGHQVASKLAARAEDLLKSTTDINGASYDRLDALEREVSFHQVGSKEAFAFQVGVLMRVGLRLAEARQDSLDDIVEGHGNPETERLASMHDRLCRSLMGWAEAVTGVDRHQCGLGFYFGPAS